MPGPIRQTRLNMSTDLLLSTEPRVVRAKLWPICAALFLLTSVTVSPPMDLSKAASLLPEARLTQLKLVTRSVCIVLLIGSAVFLSYRKNAVPMLVRYSPLILFGVYSILSARWSADPKITINQAGSFGILILLAYTISFCWSCEDDTRVLLRWQAIGLCLISLILLAFRFGAPKYGALTRDSMGLFHSTFAGAAASLGLTIVVLSKFLWNWRWAAHLIWVAVPLHLAVMLVSQNRMSLGLALLINGLAMFLFKPLHWIARIILFLGVVGLLYVAIDPGAEVIEKGARKLGFFVAQGQKQSELKTLSGRTEMWAEMWRSFRDSPWIGHGYFVTSRTGLVYVWGEWANWTAHNAWLQLLVTTGIVGAFLFALFLVQLIWESIRLSNQRDPASRRYLGFFLVVSLWYLGWGMLNSSIFGPTGPDSVSFFLFAGISIGYSGHSQRSPMPEPLL